MWVDFSSFLSKEKSTKKSSTKYVGENSPRISAEAFLKELKVACKGLVTTGFAFIGLVAWRCWTDNTLGKLFVHSKIG